MRLVKKKKQPNKQLVSDTVVISYKRFLHPYLMQALLFTALCGVNGYY